MNTGFAVYSITLGRFVTGVHDSAAKAEAAEGAKAPKGHKHETRQV